MTKEEWVKVRGEPYIPLGVWFSYYKENGGTIEDPIHFEEEFDRCVSGGTSIFHMHGRIMKMDIHTATDRLFRYYDSIFSI